MNSRRRSEGDEADAIPTDAWIDKEVEKSELFFAQWERARRQDIEVWRLLPVSAGVWASVAAGLTSGSLVVGLVNGLVWWILIRWVIGALWNWCLERTGRPIVDLMLWENMKGCGCAIPMYIAVGWPAHAVGLVVLGIRLSHLGSNPLLVGLVLALCFLTSIVLVGK